MKSEAELTVLHPSIRARAASLRTIAILFASFFAFSFGLTLFSGREAAGTNATAAAKHPRPDPVLEALVHYATVNTTPVYAARMSTAEVNCIVAALRRCQNACNFLVFGLTHETFLWHSVNHGGRTVFIDESAYWVSKYEERFKGIEAYDVKFTTRVSELYDLLEHAKGELKGECRPVQNLLFSDCKLGINDLPNHIYDIAWDVILVDGPRGYPVSAPGRMAAIFTAGVLSRSKVGGAPETEVFVHEIYREAERVSSERFLCRENVVNRVGALGHYRVAKQDPQKYMFCSSAQFSSSSSPPSDR
ncbi:unnamed protein product [Cuscuta epithymum]|uniref:Polysaccharide biosynthesis domain-containing protein n=1 Tax=Cuscuta epithymum TaxID=186058 RepID=A0AAV0D6W6_9ASTE|nr:unnamed protein product [Cuscuta epithymum]